MRGRMQCVAAREPEDVFDFLADLRNERSWNPRVVAIDKASPGPIGQGTTFLGRYRALGPLETQLTEYDRPHRLAFRSHGPRMVIAGAFSLERVRDGTEVELTAVFDPQGPLRLLSPLLALLMGRQNKAAARRLTGALAASVRTDGSG